jgi:hypothetical protein
VPIIYEGCTSNNKIQEYSVPLITTDLEYCENNIDSISSDGFIMLSRDIDEGDIVGKYTGEPGLNKRFSIANLQDAYFRDNRILLQGNMNGQDVTFNSAKKVRNIKDFKVRLCCEEFNPDDYITINIGGTEYQAEVKSADLNIMNNILKLNLAF